MKPLLFLFFLVFVFVLASYFLPSPETRKRSPSVKNQLSIASREVLYKQVQRKAAFTKRYILQQGLSSRYAFLLDMSLPSGRNRFFVYDLTKDTICLSGLVAHGSCNTRFLQEPQFSNTPQSGCTAMGHYKVGYSYRGRFGKAFKLYGLDSTNKNAFQRNIVLHSYHAIPESEIYPRPIANSLGCPMVSPNFLIKAARLLESEKKPVLLWIYQ